MLVARKTMTYAGKRLGVGDEFEPRTARDARILRAIGKADAPPPPDLLDDLRAAAEARGVKVDKRWGEERLHDEIAKAEKPQTYKRRDLRAEDN